MKILSCGAGMQSTALALMSCENKMRGIIHKEVPIYDAVVFCDLGLEPYWVKDQVEFIKNACKKAGILFKIIDSNLYKDYMDNFGEGHVSSVPFWSVDENGKKVRSMLEVDFVVNKTEKRYYIQSALTVADEDKRKQEVNSLNRIDDSYTKIVVVRDNVMPWTDDKGILYINIEDFLLEKINEL